MSKYKAIITTAGAAKIAAASAGGTQLKITRMAVGDGNGTLPTPNPAQAKLINEKYRATLNGLTIDKTLKNHIVAELIVPANVGGFWMREMGVYDDFGTLIAVSNMAESYKPKLEEGSGRTQTLRMILIVSSTGAINVIAGGDTVLATKDFVADAIKEHEKTRNHPDASTTAKGLVQLSSATTSAEETKAATPKAVKAINDASAKKSANLSDLTDKSAARGNLALGSAATKNVGVEGGQVMAVGAFGLGMGGRQFDDAYSNIAQIYRVNVSSENKPPISGNIAAGVISLPCDAAPSAGYIAVSGVGHGFIGYSNRPENGVRWSRIYTTDYKPTAADVGALTDAQAVQKYVQRSIKVNGKPLSADVNLLAADVNAWNKTEADGRFVKRTGDTMTGQLVIDGATVLPTQPLRAMADVPALWKQGISLSTLEFDDPYTKDYPAQPYSTLVNLSATEHRGIQLLSEKATNAFWLRSADAKKYSDFVKLYHSGNKPTAADVGALTDTQAAQKYALRSYKVNGKPLSGNVNLLAGDVNAWNKSEADGRYLMKSGGQLTGIVKTSAEIQSTSTDNYRIVGGDYGTFWRNDGNNLYLMLTNAKNQYGTFNGLRPFSVDVKNGNINFGHSANVNNDMNVVNNLSVNGQGFIFKGGVTSYEGGGERHHQTNGLLLRGEGALRAEIYHHETIGKHHALSFHVGNGTESDGWFDFRAGGSVYLNGPDASLNIGPAVHASDGNIMGSRWGNKWLWDAVIEQVNSRVDWNSFNNRSHISGNRNAWWYKDELTGFIHQGGVVERGANYATWVNFPRGFTQDCFGVQLTLTAHWGSTGNNIEATDVGGGGFNAVMSENERIVFWSAVGV
ncbi:phage tail protein [Serratia quinivorans]|uniref:phage tail protein n=1 Tax=Serratia quinivorans TaxID=137545 RepID=UPI002178B08C|nr:phage tail protein [Serratia quinivorans]CAI1018836.1 Phage tail fibre repeat [Serratia quinivorans]